MTEHDPRWKDVAYVQEFIIASPPDDCDPGKEQIDNMVRIIGQELFDALCHSRLSQV